MYYNVPKLPGIAQITMIYARYRENVRNCLQILAQWYFAFNYSEFIG